MRIRPAINQQDIRVVVDPALSLGVEDLDEQIADAKVGD